MSASLESANEEWLEKARLYWKERKSGLTVVRRIICQVILEQVGTFDAEELLESCRKEDAQISLSTVYRTLRNLVEADLIMEIEGPDDRHVYNIKRGQESSHSTLVCTDCNSVFVIDDPCMALRESNTARQMGFTPKKLSLRLESSCDALKSSGTCKHGKLEEGK